MSTSKDQPKPRQYLIADEWGYFSTNTRLCCGLLANRDSCNLEPSSRNIFADGTVWVGDAGKINVRPKAIKSFKGYFDLLYKELPRIFSIEPLWRVLGGAILLLSEWESSEKGLAHESTNESDAGATASNDSRARSIKHPSKKKERCAPIKAKAGESISDLFGRLYANAPEDFTQEYAVSMLMELELAYRTRPRLPSEESEALFRELMPATEAIERSSARNNGGAKRKRVRIKEDPGLPEGTRRCTRQNGEPATIDLT